MITQETTKDPSSVASTLASLIRATSLEATLPKFAELREVREILPSTTPIYLSAPPGCGQGRLLEAVGLVRKAGFEPVPHIAARSYPSREALDDFLRLVTTEHGVTRALLIAGDLDRPLGPFSGAAAVISSDLLQHRGISEIGISGYPDGHAKLSDGILRRALEAKLEAARVGGLKVAIVSQFCFDAEQIVKWILSVRSLGVDVPIRIGIAGPTSASGLARFALRCGVRNSLKAVLSGNATALSGEIAPEEIIAGIAHAHDIVSLGDIVFHLYSFGGLVRTGRWLQARPGYQC